MVIMNANCKGNSCLCRVNGHFEQFLIVVMHSMLTIFPTCVPPMICAIINLRARHQMIKHVPLQSLKAASRFVSKITRTPTLRATRCGGILARVTVLRNSVPIAIAWSSFVSTESNTPPTPWRIQMWVPNRKQWKGKQSRHAPWFATLWRGRGACWSSGMGLGRIDKLQLLTRTCTKPTQGG
jgi:hypothetical protein